MAHYQFRCLLVFTISVLCLRILSFFNTWSKMQSGMAPPPPFPLQSASPLFHLSLSFFSFPLSLTVWSAFQVVSVHVTLRAFTSEMHLWKQGWVGYSPALSSLSHHHFPIQRKASDFCVFFLNVTSVSQVPVCWVAHCPCVLAWKWILPLVGAGWGQNMSALATLTPHLSVTYQHCTCSLTVWLTGSAQYLHCLYVRAGCAV